MNNDETRAYELSSQLYDDLKDKYFSLKLTYHQTLLSNQRIKGLIPSDFRSEYNKRRNGRNRFNLALKLSKELIERTAVKNNWKLNEVIELLTELNELKIKPIDKEQLKIELNNKRYAPID